MSDRRVEYEFKISFDYLDSEQVFSGSINYDPEVGGNDPRITSSVEHATALSWAIQHELDPEFFDRTFGF